MDSFQSRGGQGGSLPINDGFRLSIYSIDLFTKGISAYLYGVFILIFIYWAALKMAPAIIRSPFPWLGKDGRATGQAWRT
jgi:hypothetical protein